MAQLALNIIDWSDADQLKTDVDPATRKLLESQGAEGSPYARRGGKVKDAPYDTTEEVRMVDGVITQSLSTSSSFFASTTILIIGGLLALLGTTDKAVELVREIPFAQQTPVLVFEFKILVLIAIFVYAFFRFSWSMRQFTFAAIVIGSMPDAREFSAGTADREQFARRASALLGLAADTFNDGLRGYYFSFACMAWFFSPLAFVLATALIVVILYSREFRSDVLGVLKE